MVNKQFEAGGNMDAWPPNEHGRPTQAAVIGIYHPKKGKRFELLWTGQFPDLQPALYWAAKKELEAVRKGKWMMASRIVWQHELTPEQALAHIRSQTEKQIDATLRSYRRGDAEPDFGSGPMQPIAPDAPVERIVEICPNDGGDPLASFVVPPGEFPLLPSDDTPEGWIPNDPRRG